MRNTVWVVAALAIGLPGAAWAQPAPAPAAPLTYTQALDAGALQQVQQKLKDAGSFNGQVDGKWGSDSESALQQFQRTHGLQVTSDLNQATATILGLRPADLVAAAAPAAAPPPAAPGRVYRLEASSVRMVQQQLLRYGFYHGAIDGVWGAGTEAAMNAFQTQQGLPETSILNAATVRALGLDPNSMAIQD